MASQKHLSSWGPVCTMHTHKEQESELVFPKAYRLKSGKEGILQKTTQKLFPKKVK